MTTRTNPYDSKNSNLIKIGSNLKKLRNKKKLSIEAFAEQVSLSSKSVSNYERGLNLISIESIIKIHESRLFEEYNLSELFQILIIDVFDSSEREND